MMEKISRKGFLKVAAAAAMSGITAAGLAACNAASSASGVSSATGIYTPRHLHRYCQGHERDHRHCHL